MDDRPIIGTVIRPTLPALEPASPSRSQRPDDSPIPMSPTREIRSPRRYLPTADNTHGHFSPNYISPSSPIGEGSQRAVDTGHEEASAVHSDGMRSHDGTSFDGVPSTDQMRTLYNDPVYQLLRRQVMEEVSKKLAEAYLGATMSTTGPLSGLSREGMEYLYNHQYYGSRRIAPLSADRWLIPSLNLASRGSSSHIRPEVSARSARSSSHSLISNVKSIFSGHHAGLSPHLENIKEGSSTTPPTTKGLSISSGPDSTQPTINLNNPVVESAADTAHQAENEEASAQPTGADADTNAAVPFQLKWYILLPKYLMTVVRGNFNNPYRIHFVVYMGAISCVITAVVGKFWLYHDKWREVLASEVWDEQLERHMRDVFDAIITTLPYLVQMLLFFFPPLLA